MGSLSYVRPVVDRNGVMRRTPVVASYTVKSYMLLGIFLTSALGGCERPGSCHGHDYTRGKNHPSSHWVGGWGKGAQREFWRFGETKICTPFEQIKLWLFTVLVLILATTETRRMPHQVPFVSMPHPFCWISTLSLYSTNFSNFY